MIPFVSSLQIRYVKLHFTLEYIEACTVPEHKVSAIRGGIGEMLLRQFCIRDRNCEKCDFLSECPVQRILYSKPEIEPAFMGQGDSVGYVIECEDHREEVDEGDETRLNILLFGKSIIHFSQILEALHILGMQGYGKNCARFVITSITNTLGEELLEDGSIRMDRYQIRLVSDYVEYRKRQLKKEGYDGTCTLQFSSPVTIKHQGQFIHDFQPDALLAAAARRVYILNCYEGIDTDRHALQEGLEAVKEAQSCRQVKVDRYSSRKGEKMTLHGFMGSVRLTDVSERALEMLLVCELIHIGKNTSFGFGRYRILLHGSA